MDLFYKKTAENNILNKPDDVFRYLRDFPNKDKSRQSTLYFNQNNITNQSLKRAMLDFMIKIYKNTHIQVLILFNKNHFIKQLADISNEFVLWKSDNSIILYTLISY